MNNIMQSTLFSKENFNIEKTKPKKFQRQKTVIDLFPNSQPVFLINQAKPLANTTFDEKYYELEQIPDPERRAVSQWALLHDLANKFIQQAKNSPI